MTQYIAKRLRLSSGERISVLQRESGLPVHEATLFLDRFRTRGRAANTIHFVCSTLTLVHRELDVAGINLLERLRNAQFLSRPELNRLAMAAQYKIDDHSEEGGKTTKGTISIHRVHPKINPSKKAKDLVDITTRAKRLGYMASYLQFLSDYMKATLSRQQAQDLADATHIGMQAFYAEIPSIRRRVKVGARIGLSIEEQTKLLDTIHPDSSENPWKRGFVQKRNWLIVVLLLATGMRRGELLGLQIKDLDANSPKLMILRRPDKTEDPRIHEPNTKTAERIVELTPSIMRALWKHINIDRYAIKQARKYPQLVVSESGEPLSHSSIDLIFRQIRQACPGLPVQLTSHVLRHTWNERFSEQADALGLSPEEEQKARNEQQGWADNSQMGMTYTRRHTARKGRELALRLQQKLDEKIGK